MGGNDFSGLNDAELRREYGRAKARLPKGGGRDPGGYRRLELVAAEIERRRKLARDEYFRVLRSEAGASAGSGCYLCGRTVEQFNGFVRRSAETDFDSIMEDDRRLRFLADVHERSVPTERERQVMRDFLEGCERAARDIDFAMGSRDYLFVLMDGDFLETFSGWDRERYVAAGTDGISMTAYERDVLDAFFSIFGDGMTVGEYVGSMRALADKFREMVEYRDDPAAFRESLRRKYVEDNEVGCFETGRFGGMRISLCPVCNGIIGAVSEAEERIGRRLSKLEASDPTV